MYDEEYNPQISRGAHFVQAFRDAEPAPSQVTLYPQRIATNFPDKEWIATQFWGRSPDDGTHLRGLLRDVLASDWWNHPAANPVDPRAISTQLQQFFVGGKCAFCNTEKPKLLAALACIKGHINYPY